MKRNEEKKGEINKKNTKENFRKSQFTLVENDIVKSIRVMVFQVV